MRNLLMTAITTFSLLAEIPPSALSDIRTTLEAVTCVCEGFYLQRVIIHRFSSHRSSFHYGWL
jgi:hypothetical protein